MKGKKAFLPPRRGRPPTGQNPMIAIRWQPNLIAGIDRYAKRHKLDRSTALRKIVANYLIIMESGG